MVRFKGASPVSGILSADVVEPDGTLVLVVLACKERVQKLAPGQIKKKFQHANKDTQILYFSENCYFFLMFCQ
jgi:hypothetical protein